MSKIEDIEGKIIAAGGKVRNACVVSGEKFTPENSADGINGYEIRVTIPQAPGVTVAGPVTKKVYLEYFKLKYPSADLPKI